MPHNPKKELQQEMVKLLSVGIAGHAGMDKSKLPQTVNTLGIFIQGYVLVVGGVAGT